MNIKQIINQIIDLDNENKSLKNKLEKLGKTDNSGDIGIISKTEKEQIIDEIKEEIYLNGLKESLGYHTFHNLFDYAEVFNKDIGIFLTFSEWRSTLTIDDYGRTYFPKKIKDNLSNSEIIELYKPYIKKEYYNLVESKENELMNEAKENG